MDTQVNNTACAYRGIDARTTLPHTHITKEMIHLGIPVTWKCDHNAMPQSELLKQPAMQ